MLKAISNLRKDESGQDLIEYALVAALIALGAVAATFFKESHRHQNETVVIVSCGGNTSPEVLSRL